MGYRSDLIIAVSFKMLSQDLIAQDIPAILKEQEFEDVNNVRYYKLEGWKWSSDYPHVDAILEWFDSMLYEEYGAMRIGEDWDDTETWGDLDSFGLYLDRSIRYPL